MDTSQKNSAGDYIRNNLDAVMSMASPGRVMKTGFAPDGKGAGVVHIYPGEAYSRDAERETDALIDHLFYHPNTAPNLCVILIQRLVTSNPSPRYVLAGFVRARPLCEAWRALRVEREQDQQEVEGPQ